MQQADDGWVTTTLHLDSWPEPVQLRHCDGLEVIRQLFTHPGLQEEVVLHAAKAYSGTVHDERHRVFDEPWQGDAWIDEQAEVQAKHGIDAVIAALQVSAWWPLPLHHCLPAVGSGAAGQGASCSTTPELLSG